MTTCTACGADVTGKKFCSECGTQVPQMPPVNTTTSSNVCPSCGGEVMPTASFCMHCGASLKAHATPQPPTPVFCNNCGIQAAPGTRFCQNCGSPVGVTTPTAQQPSMPAGQYPQYPQNPQYTQQPQQYQQPQYNQYPQQQYGQPGQQYPQQAPQTVLRCPTCQAIAPVGTPNCPSCHTSLFNIVPTPISMIPQGQQGGLGGLLQGAGSNGMLMGALGGAAAVIGGEMLLNGVENGIANRVEGDMGYGYGHRHHREEGMLGDLGNIANDLGLF